MALGRLRTDGDGLDLDAFLDVGGGRVVGLLMTEDSLVAEGVDEGGPSCRRHRELDVGREALHGRD